jgi:hypothetical protein
VKFMVLIGETIFLSENPKMMGFYCHFCLTGFIGHQTRKMLKITLLSHFANVVLPIKIKIKIKIYR